jgi:Sap, sulfolipid-1-addressing protein
MWTTMVVMALAVIFEPVRIALVVLMLNRPRPMLQLFAFLCVGFTVCVSFGVVVLFILRTPPLPGVRGLPAAKVEIAIGVFALLIAVALVASISGRTLIRRAPTGATGGADVSAAVAAPRQPSGLEKLSTRARRVLQGNSLWVAAASGVLNLPSANYMAALAVIVASGASPVAQTQSLLTFNIVAFTLVGLPLITYVAAPHKTLRFTAALHAWLRSLSRRDAAALVATAGCVMLTLGMISV